MIRPQLYLAGIDDARRLPCLVLLPLFPLFLPLTNPELLVIKGEGSSEMNIRNILWATRFCSLRASVRTLFFRARDEVDEGAASV
jgi:hypothetical protein